MAELKNEFSWSKSRDEQFRECLRKYYYDKYGSWGGWDKKGDARKREIYIMKNLKSRHMWLGELVHDGVEELIKNPSKIEERQQFLDHVTWKMRHQYKDSQEGRYREDPKRIVGLQEHEYGMNVKGEEWKRIHDTVIACLSCFIDNVWPWFKETAPRKRHLSVEQLQHFIFEKVKIWVKIDFAFRNDDGDIVIIDWKTGKSEDVDSVVQLRCYGLFAMNNWHVPAQKISVVEYNLNTKNDKTTKIIDAGIDWVKHYIRNSVKGMKEVLADPVNNSAREKDFHYTDNERTCNYCNYKKICKKFA